MPAKRRAERLFALHCARRAGNRYLLRRSNMIMRLWRGRVMSEKTVAYLEFLKETGLKDYAETPGNLGVYVLQRQCGSHVEFLLLTLWESVAAIKRFAGEGYDKARYYPEDKTLLIEK